MARFERTQRVRGEARFPEPRIKTVKGGRIFKFAALMVVER